MTLPGEVAVYPESRPSLLRHLEVPTLVPGNVDRCRRWSSTASRYLTTQVWELKGQGCSRWHVRFEEMPVAPNFIFHDASLPKLPNKGFWAASPVGTKRTFPDRCRGLFASWD